MTSVSPVGEYNSAAGPQSAVNPSSSGPQAPANASSNGHKPTNNSHTTWSNAVRGKPPSYDSLARPPPGMTVTKLPPSPGIWANVHGPRSGLADFIARCDGVTDVTHTIAARGPMSFGAAAVEFRTQQDLQQAMNLCISFPYTIHKQGVREKAVEDGLIEITCKSTALNPIKKRVDDVIIFC